MVILQRRLDNGSSNKAKVLLQGANTFVVQSSGSSILFCSRLVWDFCCLTISDIVRCVDKISHALVEAILNSFMTVVLNICAFLAWVADERLAQSEQTFLSLQSSGRSRLRPQHLSEVVVSLLGQLFNKENWWNLHFYMWLNDKKLWDIEIR